MVNHDIVWFYISVHYPHTVAVVQSLELENQSKTFFLVLIKFL